VAIVHSSKTRKNLQRKISRLINQSINQSIDRSIGLSVGRSIDRSINQLFDVKVISQLSKAIEIYKEGLTR